MNTAVASNRRPTDRIVSPSACVLFGVATLLLFFASVAWPGEEGLWGPGTSAALACTLCALHLAFCARYLNGFDLGLWVPVLMLLHYFSMPIVENLSPVFVDYDAWNVGGPPQLTRSFVVALLTLVGFLFGFHIAGLRNCNLRIETRHADRTLLFPGLCLAFGGLGMTTLGIVIAGPAAIFGAYGELAYGSAIGRYDPRLIFSGVYFVTCGIYALIATYDGRRRSPLLFAGIGSTMLVAFLLATGDRGGIAAFVFAAGWVFTANVRPISKWTTIPLILPALLLMPMIGEYREYRTIERSRRMDLPTLARTTMAELGGTYLTFSYSLEYIPRDKAYDYGMSFLGAAIAAIPNLGLTPGKTFVLDPLKHQPSTWLTWFINPAKYMQGGGYGYSIGAEWYFNFGIPGVCLGMIATGYLTGRIRNASPRSGLMLVWSGLYASALFLLVRNCVIAPMRTVVWGLIGLFILRYVFLTLGMVAPAPPSDAPSTGRGQRGEEHEEPPPPSLTQAPREG